ncbi:MAG: hypothetical protein C7B45_03565 [Sulfobacillus acidophilus]|uniref:Uncharacterized protein n=1 Tax=Sulfobacillus acidophilus TaxID=53633 RepID=A0A2T2WME2_9FIRM|nr:MAG: hypothetical protein C7B45_03565 [Sulfobacillus acidophilus]
MQTLEDSDSIENNLSPLSADEMNLIGGFAWHQVIGGSVALLGWGANMAAKYLPDTPDWVDNAGDVLTGLGIAIALF